jgi:hypothetical protein
MTAQKIKRSISKFDSRMNEFFARSPEITERVFAAIAGVAVIITARVNTNQIVTTSFAVMSILSTILVVASYLRRSRYQASNEIPAVPTRIIILALALYIPLVIIITIFFPRADEAKYFNISPIVSIRSDKRDTIGTYAVFHGSKDDNYAIFLSLLIQLRVVNLQSFVSRIDHFSMYQSENEGGPWVKLCNVDLVNASITQISKNASRGGLLKPIGDFIDYTNAIMIGPHEAKTMWMGWACPTGKVCDGAWLKVEIGDDEGAQNTFVLDLNRRESSNLGWARLVAGEPFDRLVSKEYSLPCK